jgi:NADPH:quinone reductase-like Zn-dependent oxidoreductase
MNAHSYLSIESLPAAMKACRVTSFGPPDVIEYADIERPSPAMGEVVVKIHAAGVGPWDAWIRAGESRLTQTLPLTLGSDLAGSVVALGPGVNEFAIGDLIFGVTNPQFTGAYAEYAAASVDSIALKPASCSFLEAASVPVIATTAWRMLVDHAQLQQHETVFIHGAAGNVGAFAVQFAARLGARVIASVTSPDDARFVMGLGATQAVDSSALDSNKFRHNIDAVIDTVGGRDQARLFPLLRAHGSFVSAVAPPDPALAEALQVRASFFVVDVTHQDLSRIADLLDAGLLKTRIGTVLKLHDARTAHEMLAGNRPHPPGKIVLTLANG